MVPVTAAAAAVGATVGTAAWAIMMATVQKETALAAVAIAGATAAIALMANPADVTIDVRKALELATVFCMYQTCLYIAMAGIGPMAQAVVNCNIILVFAATRPTVDARTAVTAAGCVAYVALAIVIVVRIAH